MPPDHPPLPWTRVFGNVSGRAWRVWQRDLDVYRTTWLVNFLPPLLEPVLYVLAFGLGLGSLIEEVSYLGRTIRYLPFMVPGVISVAIMFWAYFETTYSSFVRMYYQRTFDAILATPLLVEDVIAGEWLWGATKSVLAATVMLISGGRGLYRRRGASGAGRYFRYTLPADDLLPADAGLSVAPIAAEQCVEAMRLYEAEPVRWRRDPDDYRLHATCSWVVDRPGKTYLMRRGGRPAAVVSACHERGAADGDDLSGVVVFTDGFGPAPDRGPREQVIWVLMGNGVRQPAPWGTVVRADRAQTCDT